VKRLMGFEPTTFCMASRRSSQLSYSRTSGEYSCGWQERSQRGLLANYLKFGMVALFVTLWVRGGSPSPVAGSGAFTH
jgi:hypothetical protein